MPPERTPANIGHPDIENWQPHKSRLRRRHDIAILRNYDMADISRASRKGCIGPRLIDIGIMELLQDLAPSGFVNCAHFRGVARTKFSKGKMCHKAELATESRDHSVT